MFDLIEKILVNAYNDKNLTLSFLFIVIVAILFLINIILGTLIGSKEQSFNFKKFLFGILKGLAICITMFVFCYIINVFTLAINEIESIEIGTDFVSLMEIVAILIAQGIDIAKECVEKFKSIRELKFIVYDDIKVKAKNEGQVE